MTPSKKDIGRHLKRRLQKAGLAKKPSVTGMAWYRRETYADCLRIFSDSNELPDTFDDFIRIAEHREKQITNQGMKVVRAEINPQTFPRWCADHGYANIDTHARMAFANEFAIRVLVDDSESHN